MKNIKNLQILSDGLLGLTPPVIPIDDTKFTMEVYSSGGSQRETICKTAGCAVGWAPFFGIDKQRKEGFVSYSQRVFSLGESSWEYLFSYKWEDVDNSRRGAGLRIKYYLEHGLPRNWQKQMEGTAPLSYRKYDVS